MKKENCWRRLWRWTRKPQLHPAGPGSHNCGASSHNCGASSHNAGASSHNAGASSHDAGASSHDAGASSHNSGASSHNSTASSHDQSASLYWPPRLCRLMCGGGSAPPKATLLSSGAMPRDPLARPNSYEGGTAPEITHCFRRGVATAAHRTAKPSSNYSSLLRQSSYSGVWTRVALSKKSELHTFQ